MMTKALQISSLFLPVTLLGGCGTVYSLAQDEDRLLIYSGIRSPEFTVGLFTSEGKGGDINQGISDFPDYTGVLLGWIAWLFFDSWISFAADTASVPYTLLREVWRPHATGYIP